MESRVSSSPMVGYLDGQWRIGSKARGTKSPVKHASEGLLPFKCTYPVHLTDVMDQVPSAQSDFLRGAISPIRETRTLAVREYEETIAELKKENFDLKLQLYLKDQSSSKNLKRDVDDEDQTVTVGIVVNLQVENDSLKKELRSKEQLLQEALDQSEIHASHVKKFQKTLAETQEQLKAISNIPLEWQQLKEDKEIFEKENEYFKSIITEKDTVIQNANAHIEDLSSQIEVLEAKGTKRRIALHGIVYKYHTDIEKIPKELRPIVQMAVQAAKECKEEELNSALMELKSTLCKMIPTSSQEVSYGHQDVENETMVNDKPSPIKVKLVSQSSESINESKKSYGSVESEHFEDMVTVMKDNEKLKSDNEEKTRTIQDLNATCNELERRNIQLRSDLSDAVFKVKLLETKVQEEKSEDVYLQRKDLEDCLTKSNQINHELMTHLRKLETFMEDLLQHRNLDSSSMEVIGETSEVSTRLSSFLDTTRRLSIALSDQMSICESSKVIHPNDDSMTRDDYSQTEEQRNPEDQSKRSLNDTNAYSIPQGRHPFSQLESHTNTAGTGKRRLSFSTLHNASRIDSENVVVLGTSNNEDLILLLNEKGDPEDVLIRNNQMEHQNLREFYGQLPRHCLDSSLGLWNQSSWHASSEMKYLNQEKNLMEQWCASKIPNVVRNRCPSSDSDIWSEPDRDVSLQRIGIDVQKSPVTQKSPRRLRLRTTNESSSLKNESSSSAVKCHPWSKRRRSGDTLKYPFVCKKCLSQSPSKDDSAEKDQLKKVVNDLYNKCNNQENEQEEMNENLRNKIKEINVLSKDNLELLKYNNELKTGLKELKIKEAELTLQSSESTDKLTEVKSENIKLKNFIKSLETKATESDSILEKLKQELKETKKSLEEISSKHEMELSTRAKTLEDYKQKYDKLTEKFIDKTKEIDDLFKENNELLSSITELQTEVKEFTIKETELALQLSESTGKLTEVNSENIKLKNFIKLLETEATETDSILEKFKQELKETNKSLEEISSKHEMELSTRAKTLEDYKQKYDKLKEKCIDKTKEIDALSKENTEILSYINELEMEVKELKIKEKELTLRSSDSSGKLIEVDGENVKLKNFIKSLETKAFESDSICKKLKQELQETRKRLQNLDKICSKYDINLSTSEKFLENFMQKYDNIDKEKSKLLHEILELSSAKNELIQCIQHEKEKVQKILSENNNLKEELEKKSKSLTALENFKQNYNSVEKEKSKFLTEILELVSAKNELIRCIQHEKEKVQKILSENNNLKEDLDKKSKSVTALQSQYSKLETVSSKILEEKEQELKSTQNELETTKLCMEEMKAYVEHIKQSLEDTEKSLEQSKAMLSSSEAKINLMQKQGERHQDLLDKKIKQITELQNKVEKTGTQLTDALLENRRLTRQVKMNTVEQPNETVSYLDSSKGSPNVRISLEASICEESTSIISYSSCSSAKDEENADAKDEKNADAKDVKVNTEIKSLKTKLAFAYQRIEILEKEKGHLREHLLAQVCKDKTASQSLEGLDNLRKDNADLQDQLQAKSSCIMDLKKDLFSTCNSLIDKQKEVDDLKRKLSDSQEQATEAKSTSAQEGSQEFIFQRSHFSSPDLGIESDPNHESSAPEQADMRSNEGMWSGVKQLPSVYIDRSKSLQVSNHGTASLDTLHAICALRHYELLKNEIQESLNGIKSVLSRASDGLHVAKHTSPRKNLECSTFKAIIDDGGNIAVCLYKARELVEKFRIEPCPSIEELNKLVQQNQEMQEKLNSYFESRRDQERYFDEAMERLKQTEILKQQMEKKITQKLVKTKKVIRKAEKLLERENQDKSPLPKYPTDEPTCQKKR